MEVKTESFRRLVHFSPLRYPGGKGKLAGFIKKILEENNLVDGQYVEPYAGGAGVALELLFQEYVSEIHINDLSRPIYAFWKSILENTDKFVKRVRDAKLDVRSWDKQKSVLANQDEYDLLDLGFAVFYLNRTNCSGILNGGIIGGRSQCGRWGMSARYNPDELIHRIESVARLKNRISVYSEDAIGFLRKNICEFPQNTLIYLDPPYYVKGKALYLDYYSHKDHVEIAKYVRSNIKSQKWIVSYDNVPEIRALYSGSKYIAYGLGYSARESRVGAEIMFFEKSLKIPKIVGAMRQF